MSIPLTYEELCLDWEKQYLARKNAATITSLRASHAELLAVAKEAQNIINIIGVERTWSGPETQCWHLLKAAIVAAEEIAR